MHPKRAFPGIRDPCLGVPDLAFADWNCNCDCSQSCKENCCTDGVLLNWTDCITIEGSANAPVCTPHSLGSLYVGGQRGLISCVTALSPMCCTTFIRSPSMRWSEHTGSCAGQQRMTPNMTSDAMQACHGHHLPSCFARSGSARAHITFVSPSLSLLSQGLPRSSAFISLQLQRGTGGRPDLATFVIKPANSFTARWADFGTRLLHSVYNTGSPE